MSKPSLHPGKGIFMAEKRPCSVEQGNGGALDGAEKLDPAAVLARVDGNVQLLRELVTIFVEDCPKWMTDIRVAIQQGDAFGLRYSAHQLRGSVGNFGTPAAYQSARQLEETARAGDLIHVADIYSILDKAIHRFQEELAQLVQNVEPGVPDHKHPQVMHSAGNDTRRQTNP
jgi:HPt (histidine-containing phosphotransfer) domain-containing protein